ncbi:hypothetical protein A2690_04430 [Candidatus Roizmanbacteria bacterium RIFCSPHIGHO2_01_FULL_39_12b]|uniref:Uncharacterized protein n=1 Tax=Candidatus Roizmanbacteria bacterium RIFCSPHIGHO2_01_FULL_39_12b TaxID=1802030 RepID=A0A1F7GA98_9BACT|nr:MAG: hypothetical protein A2690_04430 [Candidatus Roizmanbacteria bacterium RIFCSPHIGHO2_01_FULL_39_12b]
MTGDEQQKAGTIATGQARFESDTLVETLFPVESGIFAEAAGISPKLLGIYRWTEEKIDHGTRHILGRADSTGQVVSRVMYDIKRNPGPDQTTELFQRVTISLLRQPRSAGINETEGIQNIGNPPDQFDAMRFAFEPEHVDALEKLDTDDSARPAAEIRKIYRLSQIGFARFPTTSDGQAPDLKILGSSYVNYEIGDDGELVPPVNDERASQFQIELKDGQFELMALDEAGSPTGPTIAIVSIPLAVDLSAVGQGYTI